jgi:hypothetical protein
MYGLKPVEYRTRAVIVAEDIDLRVMHALKYAQTFSGDIAVFCVATSEEEEASLRERWEALDTGFTLVIACSANGAIADSLMEYIRSEEYGCKPDELVTVILVRLVVVQRWKRMLHNHASRYIERRLVEKGNITVVVLPYQLEEDGIAFDSSMDA